MTLTVKGRASFELPSTPRGRPGGAASVRSPFCASSTCRLLSHVRIALRLVGLAGAFRLNGAPVGHKRHLRLRVHAEDDADPQGVPHGVLRG